MACPHCGYGENPADAAFCEQCGHALRAQPTAAQNSREAATATEPVAAPAAAGPEWPYDAPTMELAGPPRLSPRWVCACGQANADGDEYCVGCGEPRPAPRAELAPGDAFAGFTVVQRLAGATYRLQQESGASGGPREGVLHFGDATRRGDLAASIEALTAGDPDEGLPLLPALLVSGEDPVRGAYVVLETPGGEWTPLSAQPLTFDDAAAALEQVLRLAARGAAAGRMLLLTPANVYVHGGRLLIQEPLAPALPLSASLLADPAYLPPEVKAGAADLVAWPAAAYAAAATVHAAAGNALGYPQGWHALIRRLMAPSPADRPGTADEAIAALNDLASQRSVSAHQVAWLTDVGLHHPVNQDAGGVWSWQRDDGTPVTLAIVADGVSAGEHSEAASALTVQILHDQFELHWHDVDLSPDRAESLLLEAGLEANARVAEMPFTDFDSANATTLVAVCVLGATAAGIWCGDSRAYGVTPEGCRQLTRDHSWVNIMMDSGRMSYEQARTDPRSHVIARWLGVCDPPRPDPGFDAFRVEFAAGDRLLVCSDGLYMYFDEPYGSIDEMADRGYAHGDDLTAAVDELVHVALDRGGYDNITAVLVAFA